jgi:hypothetical protein
MGMSVLQIVVVKIEWHQRAENLGEKNGSFMEVAGRGKVKLRSVFELD